MSASAATTYACDVCTFVQSINGKRCEMCDHPNPHFTGPLSRKHDFDSASGGAAATYNNDTLLGDGIITCRKCQYINVGTDIRQCEGCGQKFDEHQPPLKRSRSDIDKNQASNYTNHHNDNDDDEEEEDDEDDVDAYKDVMEYDDDDEIRMSQNKKAERKPLEAVEKPMNDEEIVAYFGKYILISKQQQQQSSTFNEKQLQDTIIEFFNKLEYKNDQPDGQLAFRICQICYDKEESVITMKACGHRMICSDDFHQYLSIRIRDGDILPWIPCPAETCTVPCHAENMVNDGCLTYSELLSFITTFMLKKLARNPNFIACSQCQRGGFLQIGRAKKEQVVCPICNQEQTIEKGSDGDLDIAFKKMIQTGELRECPTCRHLTMKERGLCNVIECAKCGIWWNWRTREQGHDGRDLKQRARQRGTLWEPGELAYQQDLERKNPKEFKALLERNGIQYDPNYVRGGFGAY